MKFSELPLSEQQSYLKGRIIGQRCTLKIIEAMMGINSDDGYNGLLQVPLEVFERHPSGELYCKPLPTDPVHTYGQLFFADEFDKRTKADPPPAGISIPEHLRNLYSADIAKDARHLQCLNEAATDAARVVIKARFNEPILVAGALGRLVGFAVDDHDNYLIVKKRRRDFEGAWLETWVSYAGGYTFLTALKAQAAEEGANDLERLDADLEKDGCMREASFKYVDERNTSGSCN